MAVPPNVRRRTDALTFVCFLLLGLVLFRPVLDAFFLSDDFDLLEGVRRGGPLGLWTWGSNFFRPLVSLSLYTDLAISGLHPLGFHLTNVVVHALCALLVYRNAKALGLAHATGVLAGILFLALPSHGEPVAWISGRTDLLAAVFGLSSFHCYLKFKNEERAGFLIGSLCLWFLGLCAKESVITLPGIVLVCEMLHLGPPSSQRRRKHRWLGILGFVGMSGVYLVVRRTVIGKWIGGYGTAVHMQHDPIELVTNLVLYPLRALLSHLPAALLPQDLPATGVQQVAIEALRRYVPAGGRVLLGVGFLVAAAGAGWLGLRWARRLSRSQALTLGFLIVAFYVALLPVVNLRVTMLSTDGERFLYFPSAFAVTAVAAALRSGLRRPWLQRVVVAGLLLFYVAMLGYSTGNFRDAGRTTEDLVRQLRSEPAATPMIVTNLPDDIGGAYVFRNGLGAALRLFADPARELLVLTRHTMLHADDEVAVLRIGDMLSIRLRDPRSRFFSIATPEPGTPLFGTYELADCGRTSCYVRLLPSKTPYVLRAYSRGALRPIE